MPDLRAYCGPQSGEATEITLDADESHHLVVVNRARLGDPVIAFDGNGTEWVCELTGNRRQAAVLKVRERRPARARGCTITLAQALPKGAVMDAIVRKATELGAAAIVPLESERSQVHLQGDRSEKKVDKWHTAAIEAAKQCGNPFIPKIAPVQSTKAFLTAANDFDLKLVASLHPGARSLKVALREFRAANGHSPHTVAWLVGPEGDFSTDEISAAIAAGFVPITLGPLVLRCDTAATYALSVISYELQSDAGI
jgi:16S rRNA (uracil1498-N3)-methyltransferase